MTLILSGTDGLSDVDGSAATPAIRGTDANTGIFFPAADTIAFSEGGVESMRIDSSGNVGVGTSSPGTSNTAGASFVPGTSTVASMTGSNGSGQLLLGNNGGGSNLVANDSCGMIAFKGRFNGTFGGGNDIASIIGTYTGNGTTRSGAIRFLTLDSGTEAERARITSGGDLLVGATSTFGTGPVQIQSATSGQLSLRNSAASAGAHWRMGPDSSANDLILYSSNASGGVYIGNASTSWSGRSDERLKDIIEPITDAANKVSNLRAVIGKFKTDEEGTRRSFLIAQDVQAVLPEAVSVSPRKEGEDTDYLGVAYTDVIPLLVAAIKEQQAIITQLQADVAALQAPQGTP